MKKEDILINRLNNRKSASYREIKIENNKESKKEYVKPEMKFYSIPIDNKEDAEKLIKHFTTKMLEFANKLSNNPKADYLNSEMLEKLNKLFNTDFTEKKNKLVEVKNNEEKTPNLNHNKLHYEVIFPSSSDLYKYPKSDQISDVVYDIFTNELTFVFTPNNFDEIENLYITSRATMYYDTVTLKLRDNNSNYIVTSDTFEYHKKHICLFNAEGTNELKVKITLELTRRV